jgi:hypothetical protein
MEPFLVQYPTIKYAYLIELKYIKQVGVKKLKTLQTEIKKLVKDAKKQLMEYSGDERFLKAMGKTTLKRLVLIFAGSRLVHHSEI